jgi:hypothetical protein
MPADPILANPPGHTGHDKPALSRPIRALPWLRKLSTPRIA